MNPALKRLAIVWIITMVLGYLVCTILALRAFPEGAIHDAFRMGWILDRAGITLMRYFLGLHCTAILLSYSLFHPSKMTQLEGGEPFYRMISGALIFFLVLTAVYTVLGEGVEPAMHVRLEDRGFKTETAEQAYELATEAMEEERYQDAEINFIKYLSVLPNDLSTRDMLREAKSFAATLDQSDDDTESVVDTTVEISGEAIDYYRQAQRIEETGDLFTAHYYARLAYEIDPMLEDAKRLSVRLWDRIEEGIPDPVESEQAALYRRKMEGYRALTEEQNPIRAYYIFTELSSRYPRDSDVNEYRQRSIEAVRRLAFFSDEIEPVSAFPGQTDILFLNRSTPRMREFVFLEKVVNTRDGIFLFGIDVIAIDPSGRIRYHFGAPYGKMIHGTVLMSCLDRTDPELRYEPKYYAGERGREMATILPLAPPANKLGLLTVRQDYLASVGIPQLWTVMDIFEMYGYRGDPIQAEILVRVVESFTFLILSLIAVAVGWRLRVRIGTLPIYGLLGIPAIFLLVLFITGVYKFVSRVVCVAAVRAAGFWPALILLVLIQGGLILAALIALALQTSAPAEELSEQNE